MTDKVEKFNFTDKEIEELMEKTECETPEDALERWAYHYYDLRHRCDIQITNVGKTFIEITHYGQC